MDSRALPGQGRGARESPSFPRFSPRKNANWMKLLFLLQWSVFWISYVMWGIQSIKR